MPDTSEMPDDFRVFIEKLAEETGVPIDVDAAWAWAQTNMKEGS
jgi:glutamate/tyrosine decarboxylase-like PLP-dependent enzyme